MLVGISKALVSAPFVEVERVGTLTDKAHGSDDFSIQISTPGLDVSRF